MASSVKLRIMNLIHRLLRWALTSGGMNDQGLYPIQQVTYSGKAGDTVVWFPYGYHANVPTDYPGLLYIMQGNSEARVYLPGSPEQRPKTLAVGENIVFNPVTGTSVHFKANSDIEIVTSAKASVQSGGNSEISAGTKVVITAGGDVEVSGTNINLTATGDVDLTASGAVSIQGRDFLTHQHSGVQAGASNTGGVV